MELLVIIPIICLVAILTRKGKEVRAQKKPSKQSVSDGASAESEKQRRQKEIDDQITIILPIIRND